MRNRTKATVASIGAAALIMVGTDAMTYAGTGDSMLIGKFNKANKPTHIKNTGKGPALSLHAKGKRPALAVDSKTKIVRLNADRVDGKHAAALQNNVRVYTATSGSASTGTMTLPLPNFPKGRYQVTYNAPLSGASGTISDPTAAECYLYTLSGPRHGAAISSATAVGAWPSLNGADIIAKGAARWALRCAAYRSDFSMGDDWHVSEDFPIRVTLTRIDKTISGSLAPAPVSDARAPAHLGR